jgi:hypothetical protein
MVNTVGGQLPDRWASPSVRRDDGDGYHQGQLRSAVQSQRGTLADRQIGAAAAPECGSGALPSVFLPRPAP